MCLPVPSRLLKDTVAVLFAAVLLGLACSRSGLKTTADAGVASRGQAGSTINSVATGGSSVMIGSGGAGDANIGGTGGVIGSGGSSGTGGTVGSSGTGGTGGQGGTAGSPPSQGGMCALFPMCNPGDYEIGMGDCPAERQCYSLNLGCGPILCMVSQDAAVDAGASDASSSNGGGGAAGSLGTGGTGGQGGRCGAISMCTTGQTVEWVQGEIDLSKDCPADRECYSLYSGCYTTLCVLPEGVVDAATSDTGGSGDTIGQREGAPHPEPCLDGEVLNWGLNCSSTLPLCTGVGDHWCYTQCQQGGTCAGGFVCKGIGIFSGGEVSSSYSVCDRPLGAPVGGACRSDKDCNAGTSCMTSTHCGDASVCSVCQN
jgi:hypothetical protein